MEEECESTESVLGSERQEVECEDLDLDLR